MTVEALHIRVLSFVNENVKKQGEKERLGGGSALLSLAVQTAPDPDICGSTRTSGVMRA